MPAAVAVTRRYLVVAALVAATAAVHLRSRPATLCLLRGTTGLPCPFCGGTTSAVAMGRGDVAGAFTASPIAPLMLAAWPLLGAVRSPGWWRARRVRWTAVCLVLGAAEVWQLVRFGVL